jgi:hypothetical protein
MGKFLFHRKSAEKLLGVCSSSATTLQQRQQRTFVPLPQCLGGGVLSLRAAEKGLGVGIAPPLVVNISSPSQ